MPSVAELIKKQIAIKTAQAKRKAETPVTTPDQILDRLIGNFEKSMKSKIIEALELEPLSGEGGFFKRTYCSTETKE